MLAKKQNHSYILTISSSSSSSSTPIPPLQISKTVRRFKLKNGCVKNRPKIENKKKGGKRKKEGKKMVGRYTFNGALESLCSLLIIVLLYYNRYLLLFLSIDVAVRQSH